MLYHRTQTPPKTMTLQVDSPFYCLYASRLDLLGKSEENQLTVTTGCGHCYKPASICR